MEEWTFENADMSDAVMNRAKSYVENWNEMKRNHIGLLFWGPIGTGKSYVSGCIANALLKQEVTVKMTNFNTIIDDIFPLADKTEYIDALRSTWIYPARFKRQSIRQKSMAKIMFILS